MENPAAMHERLDRAEEARGSSDRAFGLTFAAVGAILALWPLVAGAPPRWWLLVAAAALMAVSLAAPRCLRPLNHAWLRLGGLLHRIVSPIILGLVFYGVLTPLALLQRARGKDILRLRRDRAAVSYWLPRHPPGPSPKTMLRQF